MPYCHKCFTQCLVRFSVLSLIIIWKSDQFRSFILALRDKKSYSFRTFRSIEFSLAKVNKKEKEKETDKSVTFEK